MDDKDAKTGTIACSSHIKAEHRGDLLACLVKMKDELLCVSPLKMNICGGGSFLQLRDNPCASMKSAIFPRIGQTFHIPNKVEGAWDARFSTAVRGGDHMTDNIHAVKGEAFNHFDD